MSTAERDGYETWRNGYQNNWKYYFDPIAVCFTVQGNRLAADLTVMPLIEGTEYRDYIQIVSGVQLKPTAGDPHAGSLAHFAMAVNPNAPPVKSIGSFFQGPIQVSPFSWLGDSVSVYVDSDPFWNELADVAKKANANRDEPDPTHHFLLANLHRLPIAVTAEVQDPLKLALFLTGLRNLIEQTAPGMVTWTTHKYHDQPYVKMSASLAGIAPVQSKLEINYATTPWRLIVTPNEAVLKRALDRMAATKSKGDASGRTEARNRAPEKAGSATDSPHPWLGTSMACMSIGRPSNFAASFRRSRIPVDDAGLRLVEFADSQRMEADVSGPRSRRRARTDSGRRNWLVRAAENTSGTRNSRQWNRRSTVIPANRDWVRLCRDSLRQCNRWISDCRSKITACARAEIRRNGPK